MPYEQYETAAAVAGMVEQFGSAAALWRCWVCKEPITLAECVAGRVIKKRNGFCRHEACGGPPAPDRPIARREADSGKAGGAGNEQGRVIRKGTPLS